MLMNMSVTTRRECDKGDKGSSRQEALGGQEDEEASQDLEEAAADLATALARSRAEAETLPLSQDGTFLFRLTRIYRSSDMVEVVMSVTTRRECVPSII